MLMQMQVQMQIQMFMQMQVQMQIQQFESLIAAVLTNCHVDLSSITSSNFMIY